MLLAYTSSEELDVMGVEAIDKLVEVMTHATARLMVGMCDW